MEPLLVHLDLDDDIHEIPVEQSIIIEQSILGIVEDFNQIFFENEGKIRVFAGADEQGGLIKKFFIYVGGTCATLLLSEVFSGLIQGFGDGRTVSEISRDMAIVVKNFLIKTNKELEEIGIDKGVFYKSLQCKNQFYSSILQNQTVKGLGFDRSYNFPISKQTFYHRIIDLEIEKTFIPPEHRFHKLIVVSQINTEEEKKLARSVKDYNTKEKFSLYMNDEFFLALLLQEQIYVNTLVVKVRYNFQRLEDGSREVKSKVIEKVYNYNDINISEMPIGVQITAAPLKILTNGVVADYPSYEMPTNISPQQLSLF